MDALNAIVFGAKNRSANAIAHKPYMLYAIDIAYQKESIIYYAMAHNTLLRFSKRCEI